MDRRHTIDPNKVIGGSYAIMRWQDHHSTVVVFFYDLRGT
jgi:hypothetical protein